MLYGIVRRMEASGVVRCCSSVQTTGESSLEKPPVIRRPTYDDVQRLSEGKASSSNRGWGSRQVCHRLNAEERKAYTLATTKEFLTLKGSGYRKERKGSPLANIYRQYCDAGGVSCVNVMLMSSAGRGQRREDLVLVDLAPTRQWCCTSDGSIDIRNDVQDKLREAVLACCQENGWDVVDDGHHPHGDNAVRCMGDGELRDVIPWTVLTPLDVDESPAEILEHVSTAPMWQIPPSVVGYACPDRSQAKTLAKAIASHRFSQ